MNTSQAPSGPTEVGFATPQLMPTNLNDSDIQLDELFNATDPLFINPQLLDPSVDNSFFPGELSEFNSGSTTTLDTAARRHGSMQSSTATNQSNYEDSVSPGNSNFLDYSWLNAMQDSGPLNLNGGAAGTAGSPQKPVDPLANHNNHNNNHNNESSPSFQDPLNPDIFNSNYFQNTNANGDVDFSNMFWDHDKPQQQQQQQQHQPQYQPQQQQHQYSASSLFDNKPSKAQTAPLKSSYVITPQLRLHILTTISNTSSSFASNQHPQLPSTPELQLYIDAYATHFSPHLPFLHHSLEFTQENVPLVLSMAAIGALYLSERTHSINIFEISRCCVNAYLESRRERKQDQKDHEVTPLWLVQALLLGVIYGLFHEDSLANEIAVAQINAVISLAKSAGLHLPPRTFIPVPDPNYSTVEKKWNYFILVQERIRTMHVVHIVSSLLATGYNVLSPLKNTDIRCGSPCDENLWQAVTANDWWTALTVKESEGSLSNAVEGPDFLDCLRRLLSGNTLVGEIPQFTLLTLICAIHLDIYEKRLEYDQHQRSSNSTSPLTDDIFQKLEEEPGSVSSDQGSDTVVASVGSPNESREAIWLDREKRRVEAILRAWETTWSLSPHASLIPRSIEGSLMSDSIPMSSLAHVRLYLDLRKTKECFWKRDFAGMGRELDMLAAPVLYDVQVGTRKQFNTLLEAASYAADTISLWEKHSARWTLQATASHTFIHNVVALFDCALIVSEFFYRLEKRDQMTWAEDENQLVSRLRKIFYRVFDVLSSRTETNYLNTNNANNGGRKNHAADLLFVDTQKELMQPLSLMALSAVRKILCTINIWPFALTMSDALKFRMDQIAANATNSNSLDNKAIYVHN